MQLNRRTWIALGGAALAAAALPLILRSRRRRPTGLLPDPQGILDLPARFRHLVLDQAGQPMSDGYRVPSLPDGMACFAGDPGQLILMRNHEVTRALGRGAYAADQAPPEAFDKSALGGVTRLVVDEQASRRVSSNLVLTGTLKTCAGGPSPWGWLACEETFEDGHGYVFLCKTDAQKVGPPEKISGYGRFCHEAVCVDPSTHVAYLTEDRVDGCFYRFVPEARQQPFVGRLQALAIEGKDRLETSIHMQQGDELPVRWVDVPEPSPEEDTVRLQAKERGAALFRRCEGAWFHAGSVTFAATSGGPKDRGQIFRLTPGAQGRPDRLALLLAVRDDALLDCPDNVTVAPWGDVLLAEDGPGDNFVRGLTPDGMLYDVARNPEPGEICGVCFSPDGSTLFLNLQRRGATLAVRGPFSELGRAKPSAPG